MATLFTNPNPISSPCIPLSRKPLPYSFHPTITMNCEKPFHSYTVSSSQRRQCGITFTFPRRNRTTSTGFSKDSEEDSDKKEEGKGFMSSREKTQLLRNKPKGFGEGKVYDMTVEDKLLSEIKLDRKDKFQQSREQKASAKENAGSVNGQEKQNVDEVIKSDHEVRVSNLPKKRNISRDLKKAFKGFPGIIFINPAVAGSKKTRDPLCRGFAFIGFESNDASYRFVQKYSKHNVQFGKVERQISCDLITAHGDLSFPEFSKSNGASSNTPRRGNLGSILTELL